MLPLVSLAYRVSHAEALPPTLQARVPHKTAAPILKLKMAAVMVCRDAVPQRAISSMNGTALRELSHLPAEAVQCPDKVATPIAFERQQQVL